MSCWVLNSGTLLGTGNVDIGVHFRTFSVCAVCLEIVGIPPFWYEKRASGFLRKPSRRSQRDSDCCSVHWLYFNVLWLLFLGNHEKYTDLYTDYFRENRYRSQTGILRVLWMPVSVCLPENAVSDA